MNIYRYFANIKKWNISVDMQVLKGIWNNSKPWFLPASIAIITKYDSEWTKLKQSPDLQLKLKWFLRKVLGSCWKIKSIHKIKPLCSEALNYFLSQLCSSHNTSFIFIRGTNGVWGTSVFSFMSFLFVISIWVLTSSTYELCCSQKLCSTKHSEIIYATTSSWNFKGFVSTGHHAFSHPKAHF